MLYYDFPDAYDLFYSEDFHIATLKYYKKIFSTKKIKDVLDCTIGTGMLTIPMAKLGFNVTGSDINQKMLRKAKINFAKEKLMSNFVRSDILNLSQTIKRDFDLVMSTGNSLAHVQNVNLKKAFSQMDSVLKPGGLLYFDSRNWELILKRRQRFYLFNPIIRDKGRVNYIQVWDYNRDGSMVFNFLIFEEINNKIISKRQFYVIYYPFTVETIRLILEEMNYQNIQFFKMGDPENTNLQNSNWYSVMATKPFPELLK